MDDTKLLSMLTSFVGGSDRSVSAAGELEVALDEAFGDEEPFASLSLALASYRPGGGDFLYDEKQIIELIEPVIQVLRTRSG